MLVRGVVLLTFSRSRQKLKANVQALNYNNIRANIKVFLSLVPRKRHPQVRQGQLKMPEAVHKVKINFKIKNW